MKELKQVREERTGWRDHLLDDILINENIWVPDSFLVSEYNHGQSVAIIEYKGPNGMLVPDKRLANYCKVRRNQEYYFIIRFHYERKKTQCRMTKFEIQSGNEKASDFLLKKYKNSSTLILDECDFIRFLYEIRDNTSSIYYQEALKNYKDWFSLKVGSETERDLISFRHRSYAYGVPSVDIDSILFDENHQPYLFIEYKANSNYGTEYDSGHNHFINSYIDFTKKQLNKCGQNKMFNQALIDLGDGCINPLPIIAVEYNLEYDIFSIYALNKKAENLKLKDFNKEEYFKYIKSLSNLDLEKNELICPLCNGKLILKKSIYGSFYGCENFKIGCKYKKN